MNTAILLSGGTGSRLTSDVPKQYLSVRGRMLITYALEPLLASPLVDEVQIVAWQQWHEAILKDLRGAGLAADKIAGFSLPGANRQGSILNGMQNIIFRKNKDKFPEGLAETDTVLIHDAARPLLSQEMLRACYDALEGHDGVMPVLPMKDTVYLSRDGARVEELLERSCIYAGQAPELFCLKKYYLANLALLPEGILQINGSTEPAVMAGMDIAMIPGDERNFKVTTNADLERFAGMIASERDGGL